MTKNFPTTSQRRLDDKLLKNKNSLKSINLMKNGVKQKQHKIKFKKNIRRRRINEEKLWSIRRIFVTNFSLCVDGH